MTKIILTIGGSDTWGGGGIGTDIKTIEYAGMFALNVLTCIAVEGEGEPFAIHSISPKVVEQQLHTITQSFKLDGIKIGLLNNIETIQLVKEFLKGQTCPIVVDPVMAFKETSQEMSEYREGLIDLMKLATISTPNLNEAKILSHHNEIKSIDAMKESASAIYQQTKTPILIKGGDRLAGDKAIDLLYDGITFEVFTLPKVNQITINGAGCTLASMLTCQLALGRIFKDAISVSKEIVREGILNGVMHSNNQGGNIWNQKGGINE